jgi:lysozyme
MGVCAVLVGGCEGTWLTARPDTLAYGIPTVCHGETEGVKLGDTYTKSECDQMLAKKLPRYWSEIEPCIKVKTSDNEKIAYTSVSYNIGSRALCHSTALRKLNAGDHLGACDALMSWTHAGGNEVPGLKNRRAKERIICLTPDASKLADPVIATPLPSPRPPEAPNSSSAAKPPKCHWWNWFTPWKACS